jgi:hypothetical protein
MYRRTITLVLLVFLAGIPAVRADYKSKAAQEAAEYLCARFGRQAAREGVQTLAQRIERYAATHGPEMIPAVRRVGPAAFALVDEAGIHGARAARLLASEGEAAVGCVLKRPRALAQFLSLGDQAGAVLCKHPGIAEPLVERGGVSAVKALAAVGPQSGRRLAIALEGELAPQATRHAELLDVVARYGEKGASFVWENRGALAVTATLTAFLANPDPFISGAVKLATNVSEKVAAPVAEGIAKSVNWNLLLVIAAVVALLAGVGCWWKWRLLRSAVS